MVTESEQKLAEAVWKYLVLYDKQDKYLKNKNKKRLAWEDVAKEANVENGKKIYQINSLKDLDKVNLYLEFLSTLRKDFFYNTPCNYIL